MRTARFLFVGLVLAAPGPRAVGQLITPWVNPFTVKSPDGRTHLWVNPTNRTGHGKALYRAVRDGKLLWQISLPYTLTQMAITDKGVAAGAGRGLPKGKNGTRVIAEVDAKGKVFELDTLIESTTQPVDSPPAPLLDGVILDQEHDRFIVRTSDYDRRTVETWRTYSLDKAVRTHVDNLGDFGYATRHFLLAATCVAGTEDILLDWSTTTNDSAFKSGQTFSLVDAGMHEIWHEDHPEDFELGKPVEEKWMEIQALRPDGCILDTKHPGGFDIRLVRPKLRVSYRIDGKVSKISSRPYEPPSDGLPKMPAVRAITLHTDRELTVPKIGLESGLVHDVENFFVGKNRIVALLGGQNPSILLTRIDGKPIRTVTIPKQAKGRDLLLARSTESRYFLIATDAQGPGHATAWSVDIDKQTFTQLSKFNSFHATAVAGLPNGGLAVLSTENIPFSQAQHLSIFKRDGTRTFENSQNGSSGRSEELFEPADLTIDSKGRIVVLENIEDTIQIFKPSGEFVSSLRIPETKGKQYYLTHIAMEPDGSAWVSTVDDPILLHVSAAGHLLPTQPPRRAVSRDASNFEAMRCEAVGPDGRLWISDGFSVFKTGSNGIATMVVGTKRKAASLGEIGELQVGANGRTYVQDRETDALTVFDQAGRRLYTRGGHSSSTTVMYAGFYLLPSGDLVIKDNGVSRRFSADGKQVTGPIPTEERRPEIDRFPDLDWFRGDIQVAPDGQLAAIGASDADMYNRSMPSKIGFYTAKGAPQSQIVLPKEVDVTCSAAFDGKVVYLATKPGLLAIDRSGKLLWRFRPKNWTGSELIFTSPKQIAVFDGLRTVKWYALPR